MLRYAWVYTQIWQDRAFRGLSEGAKLLYLAMLSAPNSNMLGYYKWPVAYALDDLGGDAQSEPKGSDGWTREKFFACAQEIADSGLALYDYENEVVFVRGFLRQNALKTIKQLAGAAKALEGEPASPLILEFKKDWEKLIETPYTEMLKERLERDEPAAQKCLEELRKIAERLDGMAGKTASLNFQDTPIPQKQKQEQDQKQDQEQQQHPAQARERARAGEAPEAIEPFDAEKIPERHPGPIKGPIKVNQAIALWNRELGPLGFPKVLKSTPARVRAFNARLHTDPRRETLSWWEGCVRALAESSFMCKSARDGAGWLNFDWLLNESNLVKVCEGRYSDARGSPDKNKNLNLSAGLESYMAELRRDPFFQVAFGGKCDKIEPA